MIVEDLESVKPQITTDTITEYCKEHNYVLCEKGTEPKTGHWVEENTNEGGRKVFCSECGCPPPFEHISSGDVYSASGYGVINKTNYCPNCGAKLESEYE